GYPEHFNHARRVIEERLGCRAVTQPLALEALLAAGHQPGAYSTKLDEQLVPDQRADLATKQILRGLLSTLEANIEGARRNLDSEFLHDLRVATRRTRSALSQIKQVFPEDIVDDFKQRFAWLQQVTGPVRDLDVYLLDFPQMEQRLPPVLRKELRPLHEQLLRQHAEAQRQLASELGSPPFRELLQDWRSFLDADVLAAEASVGGFDAQPLPLARKAELPIKQVADQRIRRMLKRVRTEGRAITEESPPEELHELRKSCKKLRYLMEFFQSLYPKERIREQIKQTKLLLDNLGRFQDTAVQAQHLREHAESSAGENGLPPATLLAMGALIYQLLDDQLRARAAFGEVFAVFDSTENAERFKALLAAPARQQPKDGRNPGSISGDASSEASIQSGTQFGAMPGTESGAGLEPHPAPTGSADGALSPRR
ncbi:CHAD domain-containing protein, partial [Halochromatium sp.]